MMNRVRACPSLKRDSSGERVLGDGRWMDFALDRARHYLGEESLNLIVVAICITL